MVELWCCGANVPGAWLESRVKRIRKGRYCVGKVLSTGSLWVERDRLRLVKPTGPEQFLTQPQQHRSSFGSLGDSLEYDQDDPDMDDNDNQDDTAAGMTGYGNTSSSSYGQAGGGPAAAGGGGSPTRQGLASPLYAGTMVQ